MGIQKKYLLSLVTVTVLTIQLVNPFMVRADDGTTPPPETTPEVTATPDPTEQVVTPEITSTPVPTEPAIDPVVTETPLPPTDSPEVPTESSEPVELTPETVEPVATEEVVEGPVVAEILAEIPEGTDLIVIDENGEPAPLATQDAVEIIATSDPIWCPAGQTPGDDMNDGIQDCTNSYGTVTQLINNLGSKSGSGTIYFTSTYSTNDVVFDHANANLSNLTDITIQGGWNGSMGATFGLSGNSTFTVPIRITNWTGDVTVNNITVAGNPTIPTGLDVITTGDFFGRDITSNNNDWSGVFILGANNVTLNGANTFNGNDHGLFATGIKGRIEVNNVTANNNTVGFGLILNSQGSIIVNNALLTGNGAGMTAYTSGGTVTLNDVNASNNWYSFGAQTNGINGVILTGTNIFNNNGYEGAGLSVISSNGDITINNITAISNCSGIRVDTPNTISIGGNSTVSGNVFGVEILNDQSILVVPQPDTISGNMIDITGPGGDCRSGTPGEKFEITLFTFNVTLGSEGIFDLKCIGQSGFAVNLPNGDLVNIFCPVSGKARINRVDNTTLPVELPAGYTYASAYTLDIIQNGNSIPVITEGGYIKASFVAQPLQPGNTYSVLYWDRENNTWIPLKDFLFDDAGAPRSFELFPGTSDDMRRIISGVRVNPDNGRVEVSTNFPGIFVLAQH